LSGFIKIGRTKNIKERVKFFSKRLSLSIKLIQHIKTINYEKIEVAFHKHYKKKRRRGEWFSLDKAEIEQIKQRAFPEVIKLLIVED
jgi:Meiotically up-regulated gene 113